MSAEQTAAALRLALAWGAPIVLLLVVAIRFVQRRRRIERRRKGDDRKTVTGTGVPLQGMRRSDRAIRDPEQIEALIRSALVCRLGFALGDEAYVVPLNYGVADPVAQRLEVDDTGYRFVVRNGQHCRLIFHAASSGRKLRMARANSRVCFEIEGRVDLRRGSSPCRWTMEYESVIGYGTLCEVDDPAEKREGLEALMRHQGLEGAVDIPDAAVAEVAVLRLDMEELTGKTNRAPEEEH
jgi:nitroimidazol reductase NimA-like FMN-containing flavoprotein (pyridoxamine 5'-phosphate oxidase superfamily)